MPSENSAPLDLATSSERYKSALVDGVVCVAIFLITVPLVHQLLSGFDRAEFTVLWMILLVVSFENLPVCLWGQTLGQKIYGLKVVDRQGKTPKVLPVLHRWILKLAFSTRGYRLTSQGQTLSEAHDSSTGVYVVRAR